MELNTSNATMPSSMDISPQTGSITGLLLWVLVSAIQYLPTILIVAITFITITIPTWLYTLLSISLTVTVNFSTLALLALVFLSTASYLFRYRYHTYGRALSEQDRKEPVVEVPAPQTDTKAGLSNYLDEFLSAIKVFGFLEKPVFHELTRTMHTRRLVANETFLLEEEKGFCLVVEGTVQIFAKTPSNNNDEDSASDADSDDFPTRDHQHGYQLLTQIHNGSPMSSLFSILSLFTEDIVTEEFEDHDGFSESRPTTHSRHPSLILTRNRPQVYRRSSSAQFVARSQPTSRMGSPNIPADHLTSIPPLTLDNVKEQQLQHPSNKRHHISPITPIAPTTSNAHTPHTPHTPHNPLHTFNPLKKINSVHPQIVARAAVDSTIAIIPASAFRRLTRVYPKATAHVVQVILNRFYRVTLATAYRYLGLIHEVIQTERRMNRIVSVDLPKILLDESLGRLKDKFEQEKEVLSSADITKGIALHNHRLAKRKRTSSSVRLHPTHSLNQRTHQHSKSRNNKSFMNPSDDARSGISAGDLFKSNGNVVSPLKNPSYRISVPVEETYFHPKTLLLQHQESMDESAMLREAILGCMCAGMGLTNSQLIPPNESVEQSPKLWSSDTRKNNKTALNSVFGLMDPIDALGDGDSESNFSHSTTAFGNQQNILNEIADDVEIVYYEKDTILANQQERVPGLYFVVDGFLEVGITTEGDGIDMDILKGSINTNDYLQLDSGLGSYGRVHHKSKVRQSLFLVKPGSFAGYIPSISGYRSFVDIKAKSNVIVGFLPRAALEKLVDRYPIILLTMAKRLTSLLDRLILHIDFALEYLQIDAGQKIFDQGQKSDAIYIILNGRLRAIQEEENSVKVLGEYGQGDSVGELEILTDSVRPGSLHAIRDSELAKLPMTLFNSIAQEKPAITLKMSKVLAKKMQTLIYRPLDSAKERTAIGGARNTSSTVNLRTVGILPVSEGVPVAEFASHLHNALTQIGTSVINLTHTQILKHLGRHAFNKMGKLKLSQYLADLEEKHELVLYIADTSVLSPWTTTCILQSDCILVVGVADSSPKIGEYEKILLNAKTTARKELVLLHPERYVPAGLTRNWLNQRTWLNGGHHHIQLVGVSESSDQKRSHTPRLSTVIKQRVRFVRSEIRKFTGRQSHQEPLYSPVPAFKNDFQRLARRLVGKSIGLVLGGGGARGISAVGIIRAMEEAGIPIDIVGGTSIGAFVGALYAWDASIVPMYGRIKRFSGKMASIWRLALDLTYPTVSYTSGLEFNRGIWTTFGNYLIEDFWLPYYCNTTNISKSCAEYHNTGYVWRYIRASMSLAGFLPPLCEDGSMLLDGGYIDNLTVAHMAGLGADTIFAIDVGSLDDNTPQAYGDYLSGFWAVLNRWNPLSTIPNPPNLGDIQSRLAYVSSVEALERAKNTPGCHYLRPPIDPFGTLAFGEFDEIYRVGYEYGVKRVAELREKKLLPVLEGVGEEKGDLRRTRMIRRASI